MKKAIVIIVLLICSNAFAQDSLKLKETPKSSIGIDLVSGFIYATGNEPEQTRLGATFKRNINPRLRWTLTGGIIFFKDQYYTSLMRVDDYAHYNGSSIDNKPEYRFASGIELTKQKGRFTRYIAFDAEFIYSSSSEVYFEFEYPMKGGHIQPYELLNYREPYLYETENYGAGISLAYGYDFRISKHWSVNAETRFDISAQVETTVYNAAINPFERKQNMINANFRGLISRFGLNYGF